MVNKIFRSIGAAFVVAWFSSVSVAAFAQDQSASSQYTLATGDQIYIQVFDEPDLTMRATISESGAINYSYLGAVQVAGNTAAQLSDLITEKLRDGYLKNPSVNVTVERYRSFFVDGEVRNPGSYGYEPGLTLAKAVSLAGGMTDRASRKRITLTREIDGEKQDFERIKMSQSIEPGDVITVNEGFF
ncbi:MAG: polysaccharide biosynthesis/export family protein [Pseudomonadota bacterium]